MKKKYPPLTKDQSKEIIDAFMHDSDNRSKVLAEKFNVSLHQVNDTIDLHLRLHKKKVSEDIFVNDFIDSLTNEDINMIRNSKSDAECRRILKEKL